MAQTYKNKIDDPPARLLLNIIVTNNPPTNQQPTRGLAAAPDRRHAPTPPALPGVDPPHGGRRPPRPPPPRRALGPRRSASDASPGGMGWEITLERTMADLYLELVRGYFESFLFFLTGICKLYDVFSFLFRRIWWCCLWICVVISWTFRHEVQGEAPKNDSKVHAHHQVNSAT